MASSCRSNDLPLRESREGQESFKKLVEPAKSRWRNCLRYFKSHRQLSNPENSLNAIKEGEMKPARWSLGVLNDRETEQVPGKSRFSFMENKRQLQELSFSFLRCFDQFI